MGVTLEKGQTYNVANYSGGVSKNFLASADGLVLKTYTISNGIYEDAKYIAKAGTPVFDDDDVEVGILFEDVDTTNGPAAGSVLVAGRVYADALNSTYFTDDVKTALTEIGIVFVDEAPTIVHGYTVTYVTDDGSGTVPVDNNTYYNGSTIVVPTSYPLTKSGYTQTGWATTSGGEAVSYIDVADENYAAITLYPVWTAES